MGDYKKEIKIAFEDFGSAQEPMMRYFKSLLSPQYNVKICDTPDYLFYSVFGNKHHEYNCVKICFIGENVVPNFNYCDYAIGFHHLTFEDRYLRFPLWCMYKNELEILKNRRSLLPAKALNRKFCARVVSNRKIGDGIRELFFDKLSAYKKVDSGGRYKNNVGGPVKNKEAFLKKYKFSLAFENTSAHGYCTEKLLQAFAADTVPIYYGDETAVQDFNPKAFVNLHDFKTMDEAVAYIQTLDQNDEAYLKMLNEPAFADDKVLQKYSDEKVFQFLNHMFSKPLEQARHFTNIRHFAEVDYVYMKKRYVEAVVKWYLKRSVKKWFGIKEKDRDLIKEE